MINVFKPDIWDEEIEAVTEVLRSGWVAMWPKVEEFEKKFAEYIWTKYALATNSCTAALHLALSVCEIENQEIITTPMTFVSTNHAILYNNWIPVFTDIEKDTLNIDVSKIEKNITNNTKAIILVHYWGHACDTDKVLELAQKHNLKVVEDCAHSTWWKYKWKMLWSIWDLGCFSFHWVKNMTTWDGWMVTTNNKEYYEKIKKLRWVWMDNDTFSREKSEWYNWYFNIDCLWYKYHMNDISAAIWIEQLKKVNNMNKRRKEITEKYNKELNNIKWLELPVIKDYADSANHNYVIKINCRNELNKYLAWKWISTWVHYIPNNHYEMYKKYWKPTPISDNVWTKILSLPIYPALKESEQDIIINEIKSFIN